MNIQKLEEAALHLSKSERAQLIQKLVLSLDAPSVEELQEDWLIEAGRRAIQLDTNSTQAVPLNTVMQRARKLIK